MPEILGFIVAIIVGAMLIDYIKEGINYIDSIFDSILGFIWSGVELFLLVCGLILIIHAFSSDAEEEERFLGFIIGAVLVCLYFSDLYGTIAEIICFVLTLFFILIVFSLVYIVVDDMIAPARFMVAGTITAIFVFVLFKITPLLLYVPFFSAEVKVLSGIENATASVVRRIIPSFERSLLSTETKVASNVVRSAEKEVVVTSESAAKKSVEAAETAEIESAELVRNIERRAKTADIGALSEKKTGIEAEKSIENANTRLRKHADGSNSKAQIPMKVEHIQTIREDLVGKAHPETGVKYSSRETVNSEGRRVEGVFPVFPSIYEVDLPLEMYTATDAVQFNFCNKTLKKTISENAELRSKFNEKQLEQIMNGDRPSGFTWHHNETEGLMQLVPTDLHSKTPHTGGRSIWGGGNDNR